MPAGPGYSSTVQPNIFDIGMTPSWRLRQRGLAILVALLHFFHSVAAFVLVLDVGGDKPAVLFEGFEDLFDGRVALTEGKVRSVVLLAIFDMESHDMLVLLLRS